MTTSERNRKEAAFFNTSPWDTLPKSRVGIDALKQRLNDLLVEVTRNTFADVTLDLDDRMRTVQQGA